MELAVVVRDALSGVLGDLARTLPADADLANHGLTSVQAIEVIFGLEDRLGIEIPDELITRGSFRSVDALVQTLHTAGGG
jgi:acyl carrier protein